MVPPPTQFFQFSFSSSKKGGGLVETMCIHLQIYEIIFVLFCMFLLEHFDVFCMFLLLPVFDMVFVRICPHFYNQIKYKSGISILPTRMKKPWKLFKPKEHKGLHNFWEVKILGGGGGAGLHTVIIREHNSGSVLLDMALYYAQYKHTTFQWRSCFYVLVFECFLFRVLFQF